MGRGPWGSATIAPSGGSRLEKEVATAVAQGVYFSKDLNKVNRLGFTLKCHMRI